ncbi:MAG: response regulator [Thermodesulfobacteriota bacterium]
MIADDQRLLRHTFRHILAADPELQVAGCAADGAEALRLCLEHHPDVALLDISMPGLDGLEAAPGTLWGRGSSMSQRVDRRRAGTTAPVHFGPFGLRNEPNGRRGRGGGKRTWPRSTL